MLDLSAILNQIGAEQTEYPFRPVKCTEYDIENKPAVNGFVYFTTDGKRIYCGTNEGYIAMGGNSGIYYGQRAISDIEADSDQPLEFSFEDIEGKQVPNIDDLILNLPDGCFYRVNSVSNFSLMATRLTVAGSGGGGGSAPNLMPIITDLNPGIKYFVTTDKTNMKLNYKCKSNNATDNYIALIEYRYANNVLHTENGRFDFESTISFDLVPHLNKFSTSSMNTISIRVQDAYGVNSSWTNFTFYVIDLSLSSSFDKIFTVYSDAPSFTYYYTPYGGTTLEKDSRYVEIKITALDNENDIKFTTRKKIEQLNYENNTLINLNTENNKLEHGVYQLVATYYGQTPDRKLIHSNNVYSQIIFYDKENNTPLIATDFVNGTTIEQYSRFSMNYKVVDETSTVEQADVKIYVGNTESVQNVPINKVNQWTYVFINHGIYDLAIEYANSGKKNIGSIQVNPYGGKLPVIDTTNTNLKLYLTALGRDNNQADRDNWEWQGCKAEFNNFLWGKENGWIIDENDETALKISNGATLKIPFSPFKTEATTTGLTIELDFKVSGILNYAEPLIDCLSYSAEAGNPIYTGFRITGQKATLNSTVHKATTTIIQGEDDTNSIDMALQAFTQYFNEDTRIHLTYVIERVPGDDNKKHFVFTYLNGVLSGIMVLDNNEQFKDYSETRTANFEIGSNFGEVYLYNIRVYNTALSHLKIIENYIADINDPDTKLKLYQQNNIFNLAGRINPNTIFDASYDLEIPYVILSGGCPMEKKKTDVFTYEDELRLPYSKSDYRLMSVKMYKPNKATGMQEEVMNIPIQVQNENNESQTIDKFTQLTPGAKYKPMRGVQVYGQGTSSMVYPIKNLRLKFIQDQDYPTVYEGSYPAEIVCFKADYMDSSSSHNTATGNLIYDLYNNLNMKTPPQTFKDENKGKEGVADYDIVTAIRGFPIICFYQEDPSNINTCTYIGRYNFNLDKATPEPFGFVPQWYYTGKETTGGRKEVKAVGLKTEEVEGMTVLPLDEEGKEVKRDIVQCWEFLNNDATSPVKFLTPNNVETGTKYSSFINSLTDGNNWINYFEDRYPDELVGVAENINKGEVDALEDWPTYDEDMNNGLYRMTTWVNSTATAEATGADLPEGEAKYYPTRDTECVEGKNYYDSSYNLVSITKKTSPQITISNINDTYDENGNKIPATKITSISINLETFENQGYEVSKGKYYKLYMYDENSWLLNDNDQIFDLSTIGVNIEGEPTIDDTITFEIVVEYEGWNKNLYEYYTKDTAEYRLAKFKAEFNQYFNKDFTSFYYILTMVLLMMDSRAKNMMMASWDQTIWYPIFYDMDTMLGVNNVGFNKFSYDTEDAIKDKVFNGYDSVLWNNYRDCFYEDICTFYANMRSKGLDLTRLLTNYNEKSADSWNEALITADAIFKYKDPFENGYYDGGSSDGVVWIDSANAKNYLYAGQGKRTNHRIWWLSNRLNYLDSKYLPYSYGSEKPGSNTFSFRAYTLPEQKSTAAAEACIALVPPDHRFELTAIANSYQSLMIGNIIYGPNYTLAGQKTTLGSTTPKHEVESWILNPSLIADLGDLSNKYIGSFSFPGDLTRLTSLIFGRSQRSHPTAYVDYYNANLIDLNIGGSCPYLDTLNIARCTGLTSIDLSSCPKLTTLDAEGCIKLKGITLPTDSILSSLYLPENIEDIKIINQPYIETLSFEKPENLRAICFDRVNYNTYPIVKTAFESAYINKEIQKTFYLTNINWIIDDNSLVDGKLINIDILDWLDQDNFKSYFEGNNKKTSITGTITIDMKCEVDEYVLYEKYRQKYPNVVIKYNEGEDKVIITKAKKIVFKIDNNIHYEVWGDGSKSVGELVSASGPTGVAMSVPNKGSTAQYEYTFTGYWLNGDKKYHNNIENPEINSINLNDVDPTEDMEFVAEFTEKIRKYDVKFYSNNAVVASYEIEYGQKYEGETTNYYYRPYDGNERLKRYAFRGWTREFYNNNSVSNPEFVDLDNLIIYGLTNLYAYYEEESVYDSPMKDEYFNFTKVSGGYEISIKNKELQGKITLPTHYNNTPIVSLGNIYSAPGITHIFFYEENRNPKAKPSEYVRVNCSSSNLVEKPKLQEIELPNSIQTISSNAFYALPYFSTINLAELENLTIIGGQAFSSGSTTTDTLKVSKLPDSVKDIQSGAFQHCSGVTITTLPKNLETIGTYAFSNGNLGVTEFGNNIIRIDEHAFITSSTYQKTNIETISLGNISSIGNGAFRGYAQKTLKAITAEKPAEDYNPNGANAMGFEIDFTVIATGG